MSNDEQVDEAAREAWDAYSAWNEIDLAFDDLSEAQKNEWRHVARAVLSVAALDKTPDSSTGRTGARLIEPPAPGPSVATSSQVHARYSDGLVAERYHLGFKDGLAAARSLADLNVPEAPVTVVTEETP